MGSAVVTAVVLVAANVVLILVLVGRRWWVVRKQRRHDRLVQHRQTREPDEAALIPGALESVVRVRQRLAVREIQRDAGRVSRHRQDRIRRTLGWPEADRQRVVVVVHELDGRRQTLPDLRAGTANELRDRWVELRDESSNLFGRRLGFLGFRHARV